MAAKKKPLKKPKKATNKAPEPTRDRYANWEETHVQITEAYLGLIKALKRTPKQIEICKITGFSINTVRTHLKEIQGMDRETRYQSLTLLSESILLALADHALTNPKGAAANAKLYFQIVNGYQETKKVEVSGSIGNLSIEELKEKLIENQKILDGGSNPNRN